MNESDNGRFATFTHAVSAAHLQHQMQLQVEAANSAADHALQQSNSQSNSESKSDSNIITKKNATDDDKRKIAITNDTNN